MKEKQMRGMMKDERATLVVCMLAAVVNSAVMPASLKRIKKKKRKDALSLTNVHLKRGEKGEKKMACFLFFFFCQTPLQLLL